MNFSSIDVNEFDWTTDFTGNTENVKNEGRLRSSGLRFKSSIVLSSMRFADFRPVKGDLRGTTLNNDTVITLAWNTVLGPAKSWLRLTSNWQVKANVGSDTAVDLSTNDRRKINSWWNQQLLADNWTDLLAQSKSGFISSPDNNLIRLALFELLHLSFRLSNIKIVVGFGTSDNFGVRDMIVDDGGTAIVFGALPLNSNTAVSGISNMEVTDCTRSLSNSDKLSIEVNTSSLSIVR